VKPREGTDPGPGAPCRGTSLAELLVALTILALGGSLTTRVLWLATRDLESAEVGLRAVLLLSEVHDPRDPDPDGSIRSAGPGRLVAERDEGGGWAVRYEPPEEGGDPSAVGVGIPTSLGFREGREWSLERGG